ncbi:hypothetical protein, partial [Streptococcus infantarius]
YNGFIPFCVYTTYFILPKNFFLPAFLHEIFISFKPILLKMVKYLENSLIFTQFTQSYSQVVDKYGYILGITCV